jgi:uncharacterized membrane protein
MTEIGIFILVGLFLFALFVCIFVLPIWAFVRTRSIRGISERLEQLEANEGKGRPLDATLPAAEQQQQSSVLLEKYARQIAELRARLDRLEAGAAMPALAAPTPASVAPEPSAAAIPILEPVSRTSRDPFSRPRRPALDAAMLEAWIGRRGLGWVAVVLLLFAAAFFLKYAFENRWIGELGRVAIGILAGAGLSVAGFLYQRRGWRLFSQMLTSAGIVLLYLATFAAFGYYHLLPQRPAALFLIALIAESAALAALYEAPAIALMAVIGGLLVPILLHTDRDQYQNLFMYLGVLNAGFVGLAFFRSWCAVGTTALVGTQILFWLWYEQRYHPEKLLAAIALQAGLFFLYLVYGIGARSQRSGRAGIEDLIRLVVNACFFAAALYELLDEDYHLWMGSFVLLLGILYAALAWFLSLRRPEDQRQILVVVATAMALTAAVLPLQGERAWIAVGWAVQGLALWWFGWRIRTQALQGLGAIFLALGVGRLVFVDTPPVNREPFIPLINPYGLTASAVAACVLVAAASAQRWGKKFGGPNRPVVLVMGLVGVGLIWYILSVETYTFFISQSFSGDESMQRTAQTALSVVWAAYAAVLLAIGFRLRSVALRWAALGLFGLTLIKVIFVDMADLPGLYRVLVFFVLAVMMLAAAGGYQKFQRLRPSAPPQEEMHESA